MFYSEGYMPSGCGINQSTLNDFGKIQFQQMGLNTQSGEVKLYVFSPQYIPVQVARPFVYQFTPDFIDSVKTQPSLEYAVGKHGSNHESIKKAILPDAGGMVLDTTTLQQMWSFVLIIDSAEEVHASVVTPRIRQIAMGYVYGEPISATGIYNPNSVLMFTHNTVVFAKRTAGPLTPPDGLSVYNSQDVDMANEAVSTMFHDKVLLGTPRELMEFSKQQQTNPTVTDYSSIDLTNVKAGPGQASAMIGNDIKAPRHQLSQLMTAIDNGIDHTVTDAPVLSRFTDQNELVTPPLERAFDNCMSCMPSACGIPLSTGLDTSTPISMQELVMKYPDINIFPYRVNVNKGYGWDATNQVTYGSNGKMAPVASPRNQMSYLASTVVQACCSQLGISEVAFSYMCTSGDGYTPGKREAFQFAKLELTVPRPVPIMEEIAKRFRFFLDDQLFDIIFSLMGDYEIHVIANMGGDILINLKLYNYQDPQDGTYFQTSARFGGFMNPMIGNIGIINNNVLQLSSATQALCGNGLDATSMPGGSMLNNGMTMDMGMPSLY